jgi:hypothetical protein
MLCPGIGRPSFDGSEVCAEHEADHQPCIRCGKRRQSPGTTGQLQGLCWWCAMVTLRRQWCVGDVPQRFRLSRSKGSKKPASAVKVSRGTTWGNPFPVVHQQHILDDQARRDGKQGYRQKPQHKSRQLNEVAVLLFEAYYEHDQVYREQVSTCLAGCDLCCWCPLDWPCHGDVLLRWANDDAQGDHRP